MAWTTWHLAPCLVQAHDLIVQRWPAASRALDGTIGDAAHQGRESDHNPNERHTVDALDVDTNQHQDHPRHVPSILAAAMLHPSVNYVIHQRRIFQRIDVFRPRVYNGINPHTGHAHISCIQSAAAETSAQPWAILAAFPAWPGVMGKGIKAPTQARQLQAFLNAWGSSLALDGVFGPATDAAVRAYQKRMGIAVDGLVGPATRGKLFGSGLA